MMEILSEWNHTTFVKRSTTTGLSFLPVTRAPLEFVCASVL